MHFTILYVKQITLVIYVLKCLCELFDLRILVFSIYTLIKILNKNLQAYQEINGTVFYLGLIFMAIMSVFAKLNKVFARGAVVPI